MISETQRSIANYIKNRFPDSKLVPTSYTRKDSSTYHSPDKMSAVDFGFGRLSTVPSKVRLAVLSTVFKSLYFEKPFTPLFMGLGLGIVRGNLHLHLDIREKRNSFFFETEKGIVSEFRKPVEFKKIFDSLPGIDLKKIPVSIPDLIWIPLILAGLLKVSFKK